MVLFLPLTTAVYAPGFKVASIADFEIIGRRDARGQDRGLLRGIVSPVVVGDRGKRARAVQLQHRISQRIGNTGLRQGRSDGAEQHMLRSGSGDDESADANIVTGLHSHPGREVNSLRCGCRLTRGVAVGLGVVAVRWRRSGVSAGRAASVSRCVGWCGSRWCGVGGVAGSRLVAVSALG